MTFNYYNESDNSKALIHVSLMDRIIKVDVDLDALPKVKDLQVGYEVVAIFSVQNFVNNATFYTDSNGLDMHKRILNYRKDFNLQQRYDKHHYFSLKDVGEYVANVTSNFYPVNSAI